MDKRLNVRIDPEPAKWLRKLYNSQGIVKVSFAQMVGRALEIARKQLEKEIPVRSK